MSQIRITYDRLEHSTIYDQNIYRKFSEHEAIDLVIQLLKYQSKLNTPITYTTDISFYFIIRDFTTFWYINHKLLESKSVELKQPHTKDRLKQVWKSFYTKHNTTLPTRLHMLEILYFYQLTNDIEEI